MPTLFIHEQSTLSFNQFRVYESSGEQSGRLIAYAEHKRGTPRDTLFFYTNEHNAEIKDDLVFKVKLRPSQGSLEHWYDVTDLDNNLLGCVEREFTPSKWHDAWRVYTPAGEPPIAIIRERSQKLAVADHLWKRLPILGEQPFPLVYGFDFCEPLTSRVLGSFYKTKLFNGMYRLDIDPELAIKCEWQVFIAAGAALNGLD